jgi:hypothetical protein
VLKWELRRRGTPARNYLKRSEWAYLKLTKREDMEEFSNACKHSSQKKGGTL